MVRQPVHNLCQLISKRFVGGSKLQVNERLVQVCNDCNFFIEVQVTFLKWVIWAQDFWWGLVSSRTSHASMEYSYLLVTSELCLLNFVCKKIILVLGGLSSSKKIFLIESSTIDHSWFGWVKLWLETGAASSGRKQAAAVGKYHRWSCKIVVEWKILESYVEISRIMSVNNDASLFYSQQQCFTMLSQNWV